MPENEKQKQLSQQAYETLVEELKPKPRVGKNCLWAFGVGGFICAISLYSPLHTLFPKAALIFSRVSYLSMSQSRKSPRQVSQVQG